MASTPFIESRGNPIIVPTESLAWRLSIMIYFTTTTASTQNTLCYTLIPKKPSLWLSGQRYKEASVEMPTKDDKERTKNNLL